MAVLGHIVTEYVSSVIPVSSKTVAMKMGGDVSSATVRNIMADLEEKGFIAQPHTSAGRIPTDRGYRRYVDMLRRNLHQQKAEAERLANEYHQRVNTVKDVIEKASYLISHELHNAGLAMLPAIQNFYLKRLELVKVRAQTVMAVLVTVTNAVRNYIIELDREIDQKELERISNFLNSSFEHRLMLDIRQSLKGIISGNREEDREALSMADMALNLVDGIIRDGIENEIYIDGLDFFAEEPEFKDLDTARRMMQVFSRRSELVDLFRGELPDRGLRVYIGGENSSELLKDCSLITCGYSWEGKAVGRIGVIGPRRMDYYNALRTVSCLADIISGKLEELS